jgi:dynein heavy chain
MQLLGQSDTRLEKIMKSLSAYLGLKRGVFPRFYFLSNEELLEILGESKKPERVQPHFKKCFEGIDSVVFENSPDGPLISTIVSKEGERLQLLKKVSPHACRNNVELWLSELESQMELSVQELIYKCSTDC